MKKIEEKSTIYPQKIEKNDINQRFVSAVEYLVKNKLAKNSTIATALGIKQNTFTEILKYRSGAGSEYIANLCVLYDINPDWLLTGRGEMLREENPFSKEAIDKMAAARPNATPQQIISALAAIIRQQAQEIEQLKASLQAANAI